MKRRKESGARDAMQAREKSGVCFVELGRCLVVRFSGVQQERKVSMFFVHTRQNKIIPEPRRAACCS